ncbi:MAG: alanine/glycine:cation symporter family protein [Pseudomonadota bacterium]
MQNAVDLLLSIVWHDALVYLLLGAGLFYSILTRFVQVRMFREMLSLLFINKSSNKGISSFQALAVSLSGRVGTGNIAGVAAAIGFGGPGAVFWMWVVAFLGASTAYIESTLGQIYKEDDDGEYRGGPAYYIEKAMGQTWYAWLFAVVTLLSCGLLLPGVQSNAIGTAVEVALGPGQMIATGFGEIGSTKLITGTVVVIFLGVVIFGGVKRIASVTQFVVPFMALAYIITAVIIVSLNINKVPEILGLIVGDAFTPMAGIGAAIGWGVKRGVYSNEAGQGTGPHAAAASEVEHPAQQGLVQAFSVYVDTLLVCTATALMILITGAYNVHNPAAEGLFLVQNLDADVVTNGPAYTQFALDRMLPGFGKPFIAVALFFFAFTTLLAYYYIAETNVAYLRRKLSLPGALLVLKIALLAAVFYGTVRTADLAWALGDLGVGLMAWLNIIALLILFFMARPALVALKDYERQRRAGVATYSFDPEGLGIQRADFWVRRWRRQKNDENQTDKSTE